jgi:thiol:disulfide interchange protein DsbA
MASTLRVFLLTCGLLLTAACSAHNDTGATGAAVASASAAATRAAPVPAATTQFTEGQEYVALKLPAGQAAPTGPIEVVEVFSYGCPHCAEFAPYMDQLRAALPKGVEVRYMPAVFNNSWMPYAQAFYAARQLGVLEQTHDAFFKAMLEHYPLNSLQDMAAWYGRQGVDPQKFMAAATNGNTMQQLVADQKTEMGWGVDATPTLVVGRRASDAKDASFVALMRSAEIHSYAQLQQLGLWMVQHAGEH